MEDDGSSASRLGSMIRRVSLSNPNTDERKLTEWDSEKQHRCRLLYRQTHLLDLPSCLLTEILLSIIKSSDDGPRYFARIRSVCKDFLRAVEDEEILRAITFDGRMKASCQYGFSGHINGLAYRCAGAGNDSAHCLLAKEVVMSVCHLHDKHKTPLERVASASFFLSNFDFVRSPEYKSYDCVPRRSIHHVEVVRTFFLECSPEDVLGWPGMIRCMAVYSMYFAPPHIFKWGCACEHEVMGPIHQLYHVTKLFQTFKESVMGLSHPSVKIAFSGLDARIRAGTKELKARMEINKSLRGHSVLCEDNLKNGLDKLVLVF